MIGHQLIGHWINHLWQSTLFAVVVALVTLAFRKNRAQVRYCLWLSASVKFLVPFALLMNLGNSLWSAFAARQIETELAPPAVSLVVQQIAQPFTDSLSLVPSAPHSHTSDWIPIAILGVWICGFLGVVLVRFRGWLRIRGAMRASTQIDIRVAVTVRSSPGLLEPGVVGVLRPILLLPEDISKRLSPFQLEAVLAHELSHVRRRDNLTAAIHMAVEAVFWFHPFVWWIGARLVEERERACDEAVLSLGGEPRDYADAIVNVCKLYVESPLTCVSGISGADLKKRIVRIMARHVGLRMSLGRKLMLGAAGLLAVAVPVVVGWGQVQGTRVQPDWERAAGGKQQFEVTSVRQNKAGGGSYSNFSLDNGNAYFAVSKTDTLAPNGTLFSAKNQTLLRYIIFAYKLGGTQELALRFNYYEGLKLQVPDWVKQDRYDIEARAPGAATKDQMRLMMQSLLADRFKLAVRWETREAPVFVLVEVKPGKLGPQLEPHEASDDCTAAALPEEASTTAVSAPELSALPIPCAMIAHLPPSVPAAHRFGGRNVSLEMLAESMPTQTGLAAVPRPVIDETGLKGGYDFWMEWTPEDTSEVDNHESGGTFREALKNQLGVKLVPKDGPVEVLVIDHIEQPSPN